ncbi:MAG TPA: heavy metal translocating P-type ATPase [Steroidobacteraceae bacterium]|nr:heavy metal translocating P-type ATPase [Steroidobacteraceae bacterium]
MPSAPNCWHCGEALPSGAVIQAHVAGQDRPMCCLGCRAAAEWIEQLGLADYYALRTAPGQKPDAPAENLSPDSWNRVDNARHVVRDLGGGLRETLLLVEGVRCTACVWLIERSLGATPGVVSVQVNAAARRARVIWRDAAVTLPQLLQTLSRVGYGALPLDSRGLDDLRRRESRDALKRLLVAGFGTMQAMMYATAIYLGAAETLDVSTRELLRWLGLLVATPVVLYSARPFFAGALRSLRARRAGMDVPVALAIAAVYAASLIESVRGTGEVYFDSVSMFVFFLLAGRYLEMRARHRAGDLTDALARLTPPFADRQREDGTWQRVGIHELRVGDCVRVAEGGIMPADGVLLSGGCRVDEALLSGESAPVLKRPADLLIAGSVLEDGPVLVRIERVGADTALAGIAALAGRAHAERPRLQVAGELAAGRFVGRVLALTALTATVWGFVDPARAFSAAVAVLVISCPCAFALAVPAAITRALGALARRGVLVVRPDAIQALAECTHALFDKTGTLTETTLSLADLHAFGDVSRDEALSLAATLARQSRHPVARAIAAAHPGISGGAVSEVNSHAGLGVSATIAGRTLRLGRSDFAVTGFPLSREHEDAVLLAGDTGPIAAFRIGERLRSDAGAAIDALQSRGVTVLIASGDASSRVAHIAARLNVDTWRARVLPAGKLAWLTELRAAGARVLAVGDGINDAPVLAGADVAIALAEGSELTQASSDIVLEGGRLDAIPAARDIAQRTIAIIRQNQRWALFYNLSAVPLAALGFVPPWLAALGMSLSSLGVILNALRIGREDLAPRTAALVRAPAEFSPRPAA